jgi:serine/threonine protein kinase
LAAYGFDLEDVQVSSYLDAGPEAADVEPTYFIILLRLTGHLRGRPVADAADDLRDRLRRAFGHLAQGNLLEAQTVAADTRLGSSETGHATPRRLALGAAGRQAGYEGLVLGGDFRLQRKLVTGGMSQVYLATQLSLNRTVAVKLFPHEGAAEDELLARFTQEAVVLAQFSCGHIVQILAAGTVPERAGGALAWMAMEYMAGGDLARWHKQHGCPPRDLAARWLREALEGLLYAHRRSVLHRDLKPHNLLLTGEGTLKVGDFGLLKQAQPTEGGLTPHAILLGTPQYMSPEQALGELLDERSDIFSLGTTFYYLLSGRLPFQKSTATALLVQIAQEDAPPLTEVAPQVSLPLAVLIRRMMARRREERYQDVGVILEELVSYQRRGLLELCETGSFVPVQLAAVSVPPGEETQTYEPPPA